MEIPPSYAWKGEPESWDISDFISDYYQHEFCRYDVALSSDGTKIYNISSNRLFSSNLQVPWILSSINPGTQLDLPSFGHQSLALSSDNSKIYVDSCFLCGTRELEQLETHHIKEQKHFTGNGVKAKNIPGNLIEICKSCHDHLHANGLKIITEETNKGLQLSVVE